MKRYTISFPTELEKKVKIVMQKNYNDFTGAVLWIVSEWTKQHEAVLHEWENQMTETTGPDQALSIVSDAVLKGKKVMVRSQPGGKLVSLEEYLLTRQTDQKKEKNSDHR